MTISAQDLKNSYVTGIINAMGGETPKRVDPQLSGSLGMEQSKNASVHYNLDTNKEILLNDGNPIMTITKGGKTKGVNVEERWPGQGKDYYAYPDPDAGTGKNGYSIHQIKPETYLKNSEMFDESSYYGTPLRNVPRGFSIHPSYTVTPEGRKKFLGIF